MVVERRVGNLPEGRLTGMHGGLSLYPGEREVREGHADDVYAPVAVIRHR